MGMMHAATDPSSKLLGTPAGTPWGTLRGSDMDIW